MATDRAMVLVPVTPSATMLVAGAMACDAVAPSDAAAIWAAMLAAAPQAASGEIADIRGYRRELSQPRGCDIPAEMLKVLPALGTTHRNPKFWSDLEVRRLVIETHRQMPAHGALWIIERAVGADRTPSKSALNRAWKRLDVLKKTIRKGMK